ATGQEAVDLSRVARPDVVVMDIRMPGLDGIEATRQIAADPGLAGVRVLVLTTFENVMAALYAGATGFLPKHTRPADLLDGIRTVARGGVAVVTGSDHGTDRTVPALSRDPVAPLGPG